MAVLIIAALWFSGGTPPASAASSRVPIETIMVSNLVRLSAAHPGHWQRTKLPRGVQLRVQRFSQCACETALFALHGRYHTVKGRFYIDTSSPVDRGRVDIIAAQDFTNTRSYRQLWHQEAVMRAGPTTVQLSVGGVKYLLVRVVDATCCLTVDMVATASR